MSTDDDFEPHLGRPRNRDGKRARRYLQRVLAATNLARGGAALTGRGSRASAGSRIGRAAGVGRLLATRGREGAPYRRRVVVKTRIVRLAGKGASAAAAHLRYLQRDGTTRDGERGTLYGAANHAVEGKAFLARGAGDRHQFRFIVSPEDGAEYEALKPLVRRLMACAETDLGTRLDWVAVDHFNTGHPHAHVIVRGVDQKGQDLVIAPDYLTRGLRERAAELVELDLGPRSTREIARSQLAEIEQERLTSIDRRLIGLGGEERIVDAAAGSAFEQTLRAGRLAKLERLGLVEPLGHGRWQLASDLGATLTRMGERGDIVRTMQRAFAAAKVERATADQAIYDPHATGAAPFIGRVLARGLADELRDRHYLIVDALDGRSHYVALGKGDAADEVREKAVVRIAPRGAGIRDVDRTIAAVAAANGGRYDIDAHLAYDARASEAFAESHVRRLEAMRRAGAGVEREPSGSWRIAPDHLVRVARFEAARARERPVEVQLLSAEPLEKLALADGATWLDERLAGASDPPARDAGFGHAVCQAEARRRQWLIGEGLGSDTGGAFRPAPGMIETLRRRELLRAAATLADELKLPFREMPNGARVEGAYRRRLDLVSGRFALVERAHDFTLAPWRPVLEPYLGKAVSGVLRDQGISWTIGRGRGGPAIS
ncbi:relaxase/mobilization nuclease RlxS [Sphingomonas koreensis]|uniref:relaxase/mobilization nuclease RlxS n=1 Tax=Sphingomonas koreensis TaxID=93064 RepID=UPI00234F2793|nr:relaxase/mobilization nuclease RlxS [Sphingomonas koreensis]MDC7810923.1 relaxase/mobilization nuclease RlxS [Sphingomonas koreensis]